MTHYHVKIAARDVHQFLLGSFSDRHTYTHRQTPPKTIPFSHSTAQHCWHWSA